MNADSSTPVPPPLGALDGLLEFDVAQAALAARGRPPTDHAPLPLESLAGRVLAQDIVARMALPRADNSAMDGYALRQADWHPQAVLPIQGAAFAGESPPPLRTGHAMRLFTGSLVPAGADAVVMQEDTAVSPDGLQISRKPTAGDHIRRAGSDVRQGDVVLPRGTLVGPAQIAMLAAQGLAEAPAYPRLRIGILSNGDELVRPGTPAGPSAVYEANGPMLRALCLGMGAAVEAVLHAPDDQAAIEGALRSLAARCDLVISVGGASVGSKDLVKPAIEALGGRLALWRVRMKPGKPVALAELEGRPLVCLPGNPASAFVVFTLLVSPLIRGLQGRHTLLPPLRDGILDSPRPWGGPRDDFLRVQVHRQPGDMPSLRPHPQQNSGALSSLPWADGLARVPAGEPVGTGAVLSWYPLADWLA